MVLAAGLYKTVAIKRQVAQGTQAAAGAAGSARYLRRTTSTIDLAKATFGSAEILPSQQRRDMRHGVRSVAGTISGELSVGGYQQPMESVLRAAAVAGVAIAGAALTYASSGAGTFTGTITRAAGSFITDGIKIGDVVRPGDTTNAGRNLLVTGVVALVLTVRTLNGTDILGVAGGATLAVAGRKIMVPVAGHTRDYYTIEHYYSDIAASEQFIDCVFTGFTITNPATGMATVSFPVMGLNMVTGGVQYFTTPAAVPTGPILASSNGVIVVNGNVVADITSFAATVAGNHSAPGGVVGSNTDPDIFPGAIDTTGTLSALFRSTALRDLFLNETEFQIVTVLTGDNTNAAPFTAVNLPRVKATGSTKDDTAGGLTQTIPFTALENFNGGAGTTTDATTIVIQDSAFV
jgi:hypothetical protein